MTQSGGKHTHTTNTRRHSPLLAPPSQELVWGTQNPLQCMQIQPPLRELTQTRCSPRPEHPSSGSAKQTAGQIFSGYYWCLAAKNATSVHVPPCPAHCIPWPCHCIMLYKGDAGWRVSGNLLSRSARCRFPSAQSCHCVPLDPALCLWYFAISIEFGDRLQGRGGGSPALHVPWRRAFGCSVAGQTAGSSGVTRVHCRMRVVIEGWVVCNATSER